MNPPAEPLQPILEVRFFKSSAGTEPVRDWLKALTGADRRAVGEDLKTAQFGWPIGMPLIRKLDKGLWEIRSHLEDGIGRVFFTVQGNTMVLLHAFVKKSQQTPKNELDTAKSRLKHYLLENKA